MADGGDQTPELLFCHACENEWHRDEHGLECPECHSDIVEVVSRRQFQLYFAKGKIFYDTEGFQY